MEPSSDHLFLNEQTLAYLRALSVQYPNTDATLAAIANLRAALTLPKGTIHVISDIHGEFKKLIHVMKNASGCLRPLVEHTFGKRLTAGEKLDLLIARSVTRSSAISTCSGTFDAGRYRHFSERIRFRHLRTTSSRRRRRGLKRRIRISN
jgi:fructose-1,6-bisphosphatase-3